MISNRNLSTWMEYQSNFKYGIRVISVFFFLKKKPVTNRMNKNLPFLELEFLRLCPLVYYTLLSQLYCIFFWILDCFKFIYFYVSCQFTEIAGQERFRFVKINVFETTKPIIDLCDITELWPLRTIVERWEFCWCMT